MNTMQHVKSESRFKSGCAFVAMAASAVAVCASSTAAADVAEPPRKDAKQQEIKEWFLENYYGRAPVGRPSDMEFKGDEIWIAGGKVKIHLEVTLPQGASRGKPCPVVLVADRRSCFPTPIAPEKLKGILAVQDDFRRMATERGYALVMWNVNDIAPDCWLFDRYIKMKPAELPPNAWGVFGLYGGEPDGRKGDTWGTIRAWAWGHSRVMDWIESRPELDARRVAVCGHSRLGKTALVAGVTDERFLVAYSNDSGVGGAHPHRLWKPGVCKLSFVNKHHLHWLCLNSRKFEADERNIPHDMDEFLALMAPRYLYVASASEDAWAGPEGEQFAAETASRAWERMNLKGWGYRGHVGGHVRQGGHDFTAYDFKLFLDFCVTPFGTAGATKAEYDFVSAPEAPFKMPDVPVWRIPAREFPITGYGAVCGDKVKCSEAFKKAIAACSAAGGGRVVVPVGEWLTGAIHLKSNVALDLREGAKLVFTDDPADYLPAVHTNWEGVEALGYSPLIYAYCCTNVAITGRGEIAPKTDLWRKWGNRSTRAHKAFIRTLYDWCSKGVPLAERDITRIEGSHARPHLIQFNRSANILLEGFRVRQSPFWTMHVFHSENVVARKLDVYAHGHNNDGIDIDMSRNVIVEDCVFDQGDDAIILKAARNHDAWALGRSTENVVVRRCTVKDGHVLFGAGSDVSGGIRNVFMHDCRMTGQVQNVFYVKTNERRGGFVENIYMKDCSVTTRGKRVPQSVVGVETDVLYEWRNLPTYDVRLTRIRNVVAENVRVDKCKHLLMVYGDARAEVDGVTLRNVTCGKVDGERCVVVNAKNVTVDGRAVESRPGKAPAR